MNSPPQKKKKTLIKLPKTYEKLYCKGEPYQLARSFATAIKLTTLYNRMYTSILKNFYKISELSQTFVLSLDF